MKVRKLRKLVFIMFTLALMSDVFAASAEDSDIQVVVATQDAQGITQANFDQEFMKMTEIWIVEASQKRANEYLASVGKATKNVKLSGKSIYIEKGTKKLMLVRMFDANGALLSITVIGVLGEEIKRVLCIRSTLGQIPISYGPCGKKIAEVFGVSL